MRNYAIQLQKAYELANGIFTQEILEEERRLAEEYDQEKANQAIILFNEETKQILRLPYYNRFKLEYSREIKRKVWKQIYPQIKDEKYFLFGTFDASTQKYCSQSDAHKKIPVSYTHLTLPTILRV